MNYNKFYVTMNDTFMSGWGKADGKTNKLIIECSTLDEVEIVSENAHYRDEMKYINWHYKNYPYYNPNKFLVQVKTKSDYPKWFEKDYFKKEDNKK